MAQNTYGLINGRTTRAALKEHKLDSSTDRKDEVLVIFGVVVWLWSSALCSGVAAVFGVVCDFGFCSVVVMVFSLVCDCGLWYGDVAVVFGVGVVLVIDDVVVMVFGGVEVMLFGAVV